MDRKRSKMAPLYLAGIVAVLVLSGSMPVVPQSTAQASAQELEPIKAGPYFEEGLPPQQNSCQSPDGKVAAIVMARPAGNLTQSGQVQIALRTGSVNQVQFVYDLVADPGTSTAPGLSRALTWNESVSSAAGWALPVANNKGNETGQKRTLTFTGGTILGSQTSPGVVFTFGFQIPSTALGGRTGTQESYPVNVYLGGSTSGAPSARFCIRIDDKPPELLAAVTRDTDADGRLDTIELTFNEEIHPDSLIHGEFDVRVPGSNRPYFVLATSPELSFNDCGLASMEIERIRERSPFPSEGPSSLLPCPLRVILKLSPGGSFDTGARPNITYPAPGTNGTLTDLAGNKLAPIKVGGAPTFDGAKPVMLSALAKEGSDRIVVTFSEPVQGRGNLAQGAPPETPRSVRVDSDRCDAGNCISDFTYRDRAFPACAPPDPGCVGVGDCLGGNDPAGREGSMPPQVTGASHVPTGPTSNQVIIHIGTGLNNAEEQHRYPKAWTGITPPPANGHKGCTNGQIGAGDAHRTFGDLLGITKDEQAGDECIDRRNFIYDFAPCDRVIRDAVGLRAVSYKRLQQPVAGDLLPVVTITGPYVTEAEINIDSFRLTLRFNGPVTSASGNEKGIELADLDIVSADDTGQGPSGIISINHTAGSDTAILTLDHRTRATDVDSTPAKVRVSCSPGRGVKAFGQPVFVPCFDPDGDSVPDVMMRDQTPPAFTPPNLFTPAISTIDADGNGYIDGIRIYFSEPIDDASFCMGPIQHNEEQPPPYTADKRPPIVCAGDGFPDSGGTPLGSLPCQNPEGHSVLVVSNMPGPYTWDTDLLPDDNQGIIRFPEVPGRLQRTDFTPAISTNPCWAKEGYGHWCTDTGAHCHGADRKDAAGNVVEKAWTEWGMGMFADKSHPFPASPAYLSANKMKRVCGPQFGIVQNLTCLEDSGITAKTFDGAPPALWSAKTIDTPVPGTHCHNGDQSGCQGNGKIDGYVLTFSEPVNDCTFRASEWKVAGREVLGFRTNLLLDQPKASCPYPLPPAPIPAGQGDNVLVLLFSEARTPDTDAKPELTYLGPSCNSCGLRDLAGNAMRSFGTLSITEEDDAGPVITCVRGFVGRNEVEVEFSEPVDNGDGVGLPRNAFVYANGNGFVAGATGISGTNPVRHEAGDRVAFVTLNANLVATDLVNDTIAANFHVIYEVAPTVEVKKVVPTVGRHLRDCPGIDKVGPDPVSDLEVIPGLISANSVTLRWVAPGNDGNTLGNVTGYRIKVSTEEIKATDFNNTNARGTVALFESSLARDPAGCAGNTTQSASCVPPCVNESQVMTSASSLGSVLMAMDPESCELAQPGEVQRARITGLRPETTYHFAVIAFDNATDEDDQGVLVPSPNFSRLDGTVSAKTGKDLTPPTWQRVIYSDVAAFGITKNARPTFNWYPATDAESDVTYFYAINQELEYTVKTGAGGDSQTQALSFTPTQALPNGRWSMHVAAASAGGVTQTASYTVYVGAGPVEPQAILNANQLVETRAVKLGDAFIINWTLPSAEELRRYVPGGELEAVQVVRLICIEGNPCERQVATTIRGNHSTLREGSWQDENQTALASDAYYRVEMMFAVGQVQDQTLVSGFVQPQDITPRPSPLMPLIGIILLALVLAALVSWAILASRSRAAKVQAVEEAPAGIDAETGLPTHDVRCPSCSTPFQAVGALPLQITCPNCGVSGMLQ